MPLAREASSTRPESAQMPIVAGSGSARGSRGEAPRCAIKAFSATAAMHLLERDAVAVGVAHHEPSGAPIRGFRLDHDVRALGNRLEAAVDVVDVEVHGGARAVRLDFPAGGLGALREHDLDAAARKDGAALSSVLAPVLRHLPHEHIAIEGERRVEIRRLDEEVMEAVDHAARAPAFFPYSCASTTVRAVMLMMRRTVAVGVRMCTGRAAPRRIGPTVMPAPPTTLSKLNEMLAASSVGMMRRLASPFSRVLGNALARTSSESAASPCISPSTSSSGMRARISSSAARIFTAEGASLVPKLECETRATFGARPKPRTSSAASIGISRSCSSDGSTFT